VSGKWRLSCSTSNRFSQIIRSEPTIPSTPFDLAASPNQHRTCEDIVGSRRPKRVHRGVRRRR
jgi:hypothetical protein